MPAEQGLLLFVTPTEELLPASYYTLFIRGATTPQGQSLPLVTLNFQTSALTPGNGGGSMASTGGTISVIRSPVAPSVGVWQPSSDNYLKSWRMGPAMKTGPALEPLLQALVGVTALSGRVLLQNGVPLAGVAVSAGNQQTTTDSAGRFLL